MPLNSGWGPFLAVTGLTTLLYGGTILGFRVLGGDDVRLLLQIVKGRG